MASRTVSRGRSRLPLPGLLACVLALVYQLSLNGISFPQTPQQAAIAALEADMVLCQSGAAPSKAHDAPIPHQQHHEQGCAMCPTAVALALPPFIPATRLVLPEPRDALPLWRVRVPPSRAPPSQRPVTAYPRGPPVLA